jgi:hypothetical protein
MFEMRVPRHRHEQIGQHEQHNSLQDGGIEQHGHERIQRAGVRCVVQFKF